MTRIALVAGQVDRAVDRNRQVRVDLDQALVVALVPVVAAPGLARDVLDGEALVGGQRDVPRRAIAAFRDRGAKDSVHLFLRDLELPARGLVTLHEARGRSPAREEAVELV